MANEVFNDRKKSGIVRTKVLDCIQLVLSDEKLDIITVNQWSEYKKDLVRRMSTSILPRLNELTGADGEPLTVIVPSPVAETFGITPDESNNTS